MRQVVLPADILAELGGQSGPIALCDESGEPKGISVPPDLWREMCDASAAACAEGASLHPQVAGRPTGMLAGLDTTYCLFTGIPAYDAIADLPPAERLARLRDLAYWIKELLT